MESKKPFNPAIDDEIEKDPPPTTYPAPEVKSSGRYRLMTPHIIDGRTLEAGVEVGDGTDHPYPHEPSNQMEGLDDAGKERVKHVHYRLYGRDPPWHEHERRERQREEERKQREEEAQAEPVSHQQAYERGHEEYRGQKITGPPGTPVRVMNKGGDTSTPLGPATPQQDLGNPVVEPRAERPLQDQMPKEGGAPSGGTQNPKK